MSGLAIESPEPVVPPLVLLQRRHRNRQRLADLLGYWAPTAGGTDGGAADRAGSERSTDGGCDHEADRGAGPTEEAPVDRTSVQSALDAAGFTG